MYLECEKKSLKDTCKDVAKFYDTDECFILLINRGHGRTYSFANSYETMDYDDLIKTLVSVTKRLSYENMSDFSTLGLPALTNQLDRVMLDLERIKAGAFPVVSCESVEKLLKKCAQVLELAKLNYEYICKPTTADKVEAAIPPCARGDGVVVEVNEINATALKLAIDFDCPEGVCLDKMLATAQKFKEFLEK